MNFNFIDLSQFLNKNILFFLNKTIAKIKLIIRIIYVSGFGFAHYNDPANKNQNARNKIRMDSRSAYAMSSQHLGGDALSATLLGRSRDWSRYVNTSSSNNFPNN